MVTGPYLNAKTNLFNVYVITLSHPKFTDDLEDNGIIPRKTWNIEYPDWLEDDLLSHFVRGIFDGDGCITTSSRKYQSPSISIVSSSRQFLEELSGVIGRVCKISRDTNQRNWVLFYRDVHAMWLHDWIYNDASVFLRYKKEKADQYEYVGRGQRYKEYGRKKLISRLTPGHTLIQYDGVNKQALIQCQHGAKYRRWPCNIHSKQICNCLRDV